MFYHPMNSPVGIITILWREDEKGVSIERIMLPPEGQDAVTAVMHHYPGAVDGSTPVIETLSSHIERFFSGRDPVRPITDLAGDRLSHIQKKVLNETARIPRGKVMSYGTLALRIGHPGAARAVGTALARNPFPLLVPCHRVVRASGRIGRFGGGFDMKRFLLEREGVLLENNAVHPSCLVY